MTRWLAAISSLIVFAHRPRGFVCSYYQVDDCINLASSEIILSVFGKTFTNSIYNTAPIIRQVPGDNLGRRTIRKIPVPDHDLAHPDQYVRIVLPLWTGS